MNYIQVFRCSISDLLIKFKHVAALNLIVFEKYNSVCALLIIATMCLNFFLIGLPKRTTPKELYLSFGLRFFYVNLFIVLVEFRFVIWFQFDVVFIVKSWEYLRYGIVLKLQFQNLSVGISSLLCQFVDTCFGGIIK